MIIRLTKKLMASVLDTRQKLKSKDCNDEKATDEKAKTKRRKQLISNQKVRLAAQKQAGQLHAR